MTDRETFTGKGDVIDVEKITPGTALANGPCNGINCGTAGTLNYTTYRGTVVTGYPLQAGYNPTAARSIQAGGTADNLWALYTG